MMVVRGPALDMTTSFFAEKGIAVTEERDADGCYLDNSFCITDYTEDPAMGYLSVDASFGDTMEEIHMIGYFRGVYEAFASKA